LLIEQPSRDSAPRRTNRGNEASPPPREPSERIPSEGKPLHESYPQRQEKHHSRPTERLAVSITQGEIDRTIKSFNAPRGYGDVLLTAEQIPRKVIVADPTVQLAPEPSDWRGDKPTTLPPRQPLFVFEQRDNMLLVGPVMAKNLGWGWVDSAQVQPWNTRDLALDKSDSVVGFVQRSDAHYAEILDLKSGNVQRVPRKDVQALGSLITETELERGLEGVTGLYAIVTGRTLHDPEVLRALEAFLSEHRFGVLDLTEIAKAAILMRRAVKHPEAVDRQLRIQQIRVLEALDRQANSIAEILKGPTFSTIEVPFSSQIVDEVQMRPEATFIVPNN
jgi:hypothetical protein